MNDPALDSRNYGTQQEENNYKKTKRCHNTCNAMPKSDDIPALAAVLYNDTHEEILEKGFTQKHISNEGDDIHIGSRWNTMRAIYEPLVIMLVGASDTDHFTVPIGLRQWRRIARTASKRGLNSRVREPEICVENNFKNAYDLICSVSAALMFPSGPKRMSAPTLDSVVGTEDHFSSMMELINQCQLSRKADAVRGCPETPFERMPIVEKMLGDHRTVEEPVRRLHCGVAYVIPTALKMGLTMQEAEWHVKTAANVIMLRLEKTFNMKEEKKDAACVRYGALLDRCNKFVCKAPLKMHGVFEGMSKCFLQNEFGAGGSCSMVCCYTSMQDVHNPTVREIYSKEACMSKVMNIHPTLFLFLDTIKR